MTRIAAALALLSVVLSPVNCSYFATSPRELRPGMPFLVSIVTESAAGGTFAVELRDSTNANLAWTGSRVDITIPAGKQTGSAMIDDVPDLLIADTIYNVKVVKGIEPAIFKTMKVYVPPSSIFIQSDKGIYKPGDLVNFRVLITKVDLTPLKADIKVVIKDTLGNDILVEQWDQLDLVSGSFILSDDPLFGTYQIYVEAGLTAYKYATFEVQEYVLPKFEVKLELDVPYVIPSESGKSQMGSVRGKVQAIYTNGEPVRGTMSLKFNSADMKTFLDFYGDELFSIDIGTRQTTGTITVIALMTEQHTGNTANATQTVTVVEAPFKATAVTPIPFTTPSTDYVFQVDLTDPVGGPLPAALASGSYRLRYSASYSYMSMSTYLTTVVSDDVDYTTGHVTVTVSPDATWTDAKVSEIDVYFEDVDSGQRSIPSKIKPQMYKTTNGESMLQILRDTTMGTQDEVCVAITVFSSNPVDQNSIFYQVVDTFGPGAMKHYNTEKCVSITKAFAPKSRIIAYYTDATGKVPEILAASVDMLVEWISDLQVSVVIEPSRAKPGATVAINIQTTPATVAIVGISGVDKSTTFLADGNDITKKKLQEAFELVRLFDRPTTTKPPPPFPIMRGGIAPGLKPFNVDRKKRCASGYYGSTETSPGEIVKDAGMLVITGYTILDNSAGCSGGDWDRFPVMEQENGGAVVNDAGADLSPTDYEDDDGTVSQVSVRTEFPETWLWDIATTDSQSGAVSLSADLPDTITNWVVNAFAVSDNYGIGVAETQEVTATQDLFVSMDLPYSVIRKEEFELKIVVFNYKSTEMQVTIDLEENMAQFVTKGRSYTSVAIAGGQSGLFKVAIQPRIIGDIKLTATARSGELMDVEQRTLIVKSEGREIQQSKELTVSVGSDRSFDLKSLITGAGIVEDSLRMYMLVTGDIMAPFINNLEGRIRMPTGCGEQNMISLVPSVYVAKYLKGIGQYTNEMRKKVQTYAGIGYRKELNYGHTTAPDTGGFSAFGESSNHCGCDRPDADDGPHASTWLTAFVLGTFSELSKQDITFVSGDILESAATFLCNHRTTVPNESSSYFTEPGNVIHSEMQGGAGSPGVALTAMVLAALLDYKDAVQNNQHTSCIDGAQTWLDEKADSLTNTYGMAIVAFALAKGGNTVAATSLLAKFENSFTDDSESGVGCPDCDVMPGYKYHQSGPSTVETLGYSLMAYVHLGNKAKATEKKNMLLDMRQAGGSFQSTQDTVVGLRALAMFATAYPGQTTDFTVSLADATGQTVAEDVSMDVDNYYAVLESPIQMAYRPDMNVNVDVTGTAGDAIVTFVAYYNSMSDVKVPKIDLDVTVDRTPNGGTFVNTCFRVNPVDNEKDPAMVLVGVSMPSGKKFDSTLMHETVARKVEFNEKEAMVYLYFDPPANHNVRTCSRIPMKTEFEVTDLQPASAFAQDYYEPKNKVEMLYSVQCDDCDETLGASAAQINALLLILASALALLYQTLARQ